MIFYIVEVYKRNYAITPEWEPRISAEELMEVLDNHWSDDIEKFVIWQVSDEVPVRDVTADMLTRFLVNAGSPENYAPILLPCGFDTEELVRELSEGADYTHEQQEREQLRI